MSVLVTNLSSDESENIAKVISQLKTKLTQEVTNTFEKIKPELHRQDVFYARYRVIMLNAANRFIKGLIAGENPDFMCEEEMNEIAVLNQEFKNNPENFDLNKTSEEYQLLSVELKIAAQDAYKSANDFLQKVAPDEESKLRLLREIHDFEEKNQLQFN